MATSNAPAPSEPIHGSKWEAAAIVWLMTVPPVNGRNQHSEGGNFATLTTAAFAALGYRGFRSHHTVANYRANVQAAVDNGHPAPEWGKALACRTRWAATRHRPEQ